MSALPPPHAVSISAQRVVFWLGITSLLTDLASEMVASALPVFLYSVLALSPLVVGFLDGFYQGAAAIISVPAGYLADRMQKHKHIAAIGYVLSVFAKIGLLLSMPWGMLMALASLGADRLGKGIRTAPRDALIAAHAASEHRGAAFGLHRMLDAIGALLGPLLAFVVLSIWVEDYIVLLVLSFGFAAVGCWVLWSKVPKELPAHIVMDRRTLSMRVAWQQLKIHRSYWKLVAVASSLNVFLVSDGLLYLQMQRQSSLPPSWVPLMFVGTSVVFLLMARTLGGLADRLGYAKVFIAGHLILLLLYAGLAAGLVKNTWGCVAALAAIGLFYAATNGVLMAFASSLVDNAVRTLALGVLGAAIGFAKIGASILFGVLWQYAGHINAFMCFGFGLAICLCVGTYFLHQSREPIIGANL